MQRQTFTVDAALLQELGERLIGRAHIAVAELVKNSYDADAVNCRIEFEDDQITITDDGHGMSEADFLDHWMWIGTTHKVEQQNSKIFKRPLTGSKGIGRLSVQFLADEMTLESTSVDQANKTLYAVVDWRSIKRGKELDTVNVLWEMRKKAPEYPDGHPSGTRIVLKGLKTEWDTETLGELGRDVWFLRSPFKAPKKRGKSRNPEDFYVGIDAPGIEGARSAFNEVMTSFFDNWRARIRGSLDQGRSGGKATITIEFKAGYPDDLEEPEKFSETVALPVNPENNKKEPLVDRAVFDILIFKPEGRQPGGISVSQMRGYLREFGNVSVYDAGFRLPYYGSGEDKTGQDWLNIAVDQGRRLGASELLPERLRTQDRYMEDLPAPGRIFGAVEIDTNHERTVAEKSGSPPGTWLEIQSSRDRLTSDHAFIQLRNLVRFSLDFYANRYRLLSIQTAEKRRSKEQPAKKFERAINTLDHHKAAMPATVFREVRREIVDARNASASEEEALDQRAVLLAPLATAGMLALALNHELDRNTRFLKTTGDKLRRIANEHSVPELETLAEEFEELHQRLASIQELFSPLLSETDSAVTDRLRVRPLVEQIVRSMRPLLPRVEFDLTGISSNLRFPTGSFVEWNAILQNILANAWNAMLDTEMAEISFDGDRDRSGREWLRVSDKGQGLGMPLEDSAKLFEPFERHLEISEDKRSIAIGGQGLGLTIIRMIAHRRGADVRFAEPENGFATTFEISWRGAKK